MKVILGLVLIWIALLAGAAAGYFAMRPLLGAWAAVGAIAGVLLVGWLLQIADSPRFSSRAPEWLEALREWKLRRRIRRFAKHDSSELSFMIERAEEQEKALDEAIALVADARLQIGDVERDGSFYPRTITRLDAVRRMLDRATTSASRTRSEIWHEHKLLIAEMKKPR